MRLQFSRTFNKYYLLHVSQFYDCLYHNIPVPSVKCEHLHEERNRLPYHYVNDNKIYFLSNQIRTRYQLVALFTLI